MKIKLNSILVEDQDKALAFYTDVLGFTKKFDIPMGAYRWLTVVSPEGGDTELVLEPTANPAAKVYQSALFQQGVPLTAFEVDDIAKEFEILSARGVMFSKKPTNAAPVWLAMFADTCGNHIQIYQPV